MKCCNCQRERAVFKTIDLTEAEQASVARLTGEPAPDKYDYCKACWTVISDPVQGAQLLKGLLQANLTRRGVPNAERIASKYFDFFFRKGIKPKAS